VEGARTLSPQAFSSVASLNLVAALIEGNPLTPEALNSICPLKSQTQWQVMTLTEAREQFLQLSFETDPVRFLTLEIQIRRAEQLTRSWPEEPVDGDAALLAGEESLSSDDEVEDGAEPVATPAVFQPPQPPRLWLKFTPWQMFEGAPAWAASPPISLSETWLRRG
jgi:hypothetical protein